MAKVFYSDTLFESLRKSGVSSARNTWDSVARIKRMRHQSADCLPISDSHIDEPEREQVDGV